MTHSEARAAVAECVAVKWRLTALQHAAALCASGQHRAAAAAYTIAGSDALAYPPLREMVEEVSLLLSDAASPVIQ